MVLTRALILVEEKQELMKKFGKKQLTLHLQAPLERIPAQLADWNLELKSNGSDCVYTFDGANSIAVSSLLNRMSELGVVIKDLQTHQSSLEDIFVGLVSTRA